MTIPDIQVFVRHKPGCKFEGDEGSRRCNCKKWMRWRKDGKQYRKPTGARTWAEADEVKAELIAQLSGRLTVEQIKAKEAEKAKPLEEAVALFIDFKKAQSVTGAALTKYTADLRKFRMHCEAAGAFTAQALSREVLNGYAASWDALYPSSSTRAGARSRVVAFLHFCFTEQWLARVPPLPRVKVDTVPTMPLTDEEFTRLLAGADKVKGRNYGSNAELHAKAKRKLRALILLMRWSGLAIRDASSIHSSNFITGDGRTRVVTSRQKTGTDVSVLIPPHVAAEVLALAGESADGYPFWTAKHRRRLGAVLVSPKSKRTYTKDAGKETAPGAINAQMWGYRIKAAFDEAGLQCDGHMVSHRLRDTFAVDLLQKGVPLEEVSKALGHSSIRTTERHYAKWVKSRQDRLDNFIMGTWEDAA